MLTHLALTSPPHRGRPTGEGIEGRGERRQLATAWRLRRDPPRGEDTILAHLLTSPCHRGRCIACHCVPFLRQVFVAADGKNARNRVRLARSSSRLRETRW